MDVKKLGRIPDGDGWRALGRGGGDNRDRKQGSGFDYVHSLVDDYSRLGLPILIAPRMHRTGNLPSLHQTALPLAERQGRAPQPHFADRMGLPKRLYLQQQPLRPVCSTTTLNDATAHSAAYRPSADCNQPDGQVYLAGSAAHFPAAVFLDE
jgi:hypothetical protein